MCDLALNTSEETKKWLLKNHPDKGGDMDMDVVHEVINCYKNREYCASASSISASASSAIASPSASSPHINQAKRNKIYTCMRQTENWSKILPEHKLDNRKFDPALVMNAIHNASPKLEQLFNIIKQVDENDMKTHGKYFKHFIFSDVKEEGYGAKILASAFIANGYKNLITSRSVLGQKALKLTLQETGTDGKNKSFGLLSSSALFNSEFNQKFKKEVLQMYNKRPDNIQGEKMRFIILDSGFKEGIDLFDVKYVHIFEPSMTVADLKQTIGRATRTCGQKGLNFEPNVGWPLFVYNYYIVVPEEIQESYKAADVDLLTNPAEEEYIFRNGNKLKDATILYSEFDKTMTSLAEQLYKLAPIFSVDFVLTQNIHRLDDAAYLYDVQQQQIEWKGGRGLLKNRDDIKCAGKCGLRSTKDIPATVNFLSKVYKKYRHNQNAMPAKGVRKYLCSYMKSSPAYCEQVNTEWANRAAMVPAEVYKAQKKVKSKTSKTRSKKSISKSTRKNREPSYIEIKPESITPYLEIGTSDSRPMTSASRPMTSASSPSASSKHKSREPSYIEIKPESATPYL
jgi:hypothetical protein